MTPCLVVRITSNGCVFGDVLAIKLECIIQKERAL